MQSDPGGGDRAGVELAFGPDVECPSSKRDRDAQPDQDERDRTHQRRRRERVPGAEGTGPERGQGSPGVEAGGFQAEPERRKPEDDGCERPPKRLHRPGSRCSIIAPTWARETPGEASVSTPRVTTITRSARCEHLVEVG